jgi:hypothetical protein
MRLSIIGEPPLLAPAVHFRPIAVMVDVCKFLTIVMGASGLTIIKIVPPFPGVDAAD